MVKVVAINFIVKALIDRFQLSSFSAQVLLQYSAKPRAFIIISFVIQILGEALACNILLASGLKMSQYIQFSFVSESGMKSMTTTVDNGRI